MKKILSFALSLGAFFSGFALTASADAEAELPFELTAPENVSVAYLNGDDSPNTCEIHYSQNTSMSEWSSRLADPDSYNDAVKELNDMGYDSLWITAQIDWSIDSEEDWHVNEYWLTEGYDENYVQKLGEWAFISQNYGPEIAMDEWIFRFMGNINDPEDRTWYGDHTDADYDGWKDVLKEDQYAVVDDGEGGSYAKIDLTSHTVYTRVRWLVSVYPLEGELFRVASDWSETAAVGKEGTQVEALKEGDIAPPKISGLKYTDEEFNGYPVISVKLDVDDTLSSQLAQVSGTSGTIWYECEARVQGSEEWVALQGDLAIRSGEMKIDLQALAETAGEVAKGTPIEFRARYYCTQSGQEEFYTDYSEILTFEAQQMEAAPVENISEEEAANEETVEAEAAITPSAAETEGKKSAFPWWIIVLIILMIVMLMIIIKLKKKKPRR